MDGAPTTLDWNQLATDPGWCKLDWVVADPDQKRLTNASNVIDVTWESPTGDIVPLDGYLDAYFQEVYLDAGQLPTFTKVVQHVSGNALDDYIDQLEGEVRKYLDAGHANYGKAAKRMYNVFRLTGRHIDAAYLRELFDEPTTMLYQVWSLITTLENASQPGSTISTETVQAQTDELVLTVVTALDGVQETELVGGAAQAARRPGPDERRWGGGRGGRGRHRVRQGPGREPDQHLLPRPADRGAVDQGLHGLAGDLVGLLVAVHRGPDLALDDVDVGGALDQLDHRAHAHSRAEDHADGSGQETLGLSPW